MAVEVELIPGPDDPEPPRRIVLPDGPAGGGGAFLRPRGMPGRMEYKAGPMAGGLELLGQLGPVAITAAGTLLGVWLTTRNGRKVRVKKGDMEAEARTPAELREVLALIGEDRPKPPSLPSE